MDNQREVLPGLALTHHIEGFRAVDSQRQTVHARLELQRQDTHADEVGTVNALEAFRRDGLHACQTHALGRPVARRTLAIVRTRYDDERLLAFHVGFDGFPHAHHLAFRLDACQRALLHLAVHHRHLVHERGVGKRGALRRQVVAAVRGVGIEVFFRQAHLRQVLARCAVEQNGV